VSDACTACGTALPAGSARCGACKKVDLERARAIGRAGAQAMAAAERAQRAVRLLLYGSLVAAFAVAALEELLPASPWRSMAESALLVVLAAAGTSALGPGGLAEAIGRPVRASHLVPTLVAGAAAGLAWWGWGLAVRRWEGGAAPQAAVSPSTFVSVHLLRGMALECLTRGATWAALARLRSPRATLLGTAVQHALVFGIAWGPYGAPAALALGVLLGWLRRRTGGLAPCLAAHALALGVALVLLS
jgi:hypothetical protein